MNPLSSPALSTAARLLLLAPVFLAGSALATQPDKTIRIDFGSHHAEKGFRPVGPEDIYDPDRGYGWVGRPEVTFRERKLPDAARSDFIFGRVPARFQVDVEPGIWRLTLIAGDFSFSDHVLQAAVEGQELDFPPMQPQAQEFSTLTAAFEIREGNLVLVFDSPVDNWVVNALVLEPAEQTEEAKLKMEQVERKDVEPENTWADDANWPDPAGELLSEFRERAEQQEQPEPTGLTEESYLELIAGNVDFFRTQQDDRGAIIDPYRKEEYQYATPCYALAGAVLIHYAGRDDLLDSTLSAMDWAVQSLSRRQAATAHEDFYAPVLAHALPILEQHADAGRAKRWKEQLADFDPWATYRSAPGGGNWNLVALSGEALFHLLGIREDTSYIEHSLAAQGRFFHSPWGLYVEGPMPYDHFPRLWAADMVAAGYESPFVEPLRRRLDRAAVTSLFIQSPMGELPTGGRSAHHQWNEAEQTVTYEIYAAKAAAEGDEFLAGVYKRAARLALASMKRWQRPSGEMWIVKNRVDPAKGHGFESYSSHSQYNLLAMAMLAMAHKHSLQTTSVAERITPAELGGFIVNLRPQFPHVFANAGGTYLQIVTQSDLKFNATGLVRIHHQDFNPQIGPSDVPVETRSHGLPEGPQKAVAVGLAWQDDEREWDALARYGGEAVRDVTVEQKKASPDEVVFTVRYKGEFGEVQEVVEHYRVQPDAVDLAGELPGYDGAIRYTWPLLADDGERQPEIQVEDKSVTISLEGDVRRFTPAGAERLVVEDELYPYHNGWAREAFGEFKPGEQPRLRVTAERDR